MKNILKQNPAPCLALLIALISVILVISIYNKFSLTVDEPCHIASGMEWLQKGSYTMWPENPPLARIFTALGPFLKGARIDFSRMSRQDLKENSLLPFMAGVELINNDPSYPSLLFLARLGMLPFFIAAMVLVYLLGKRFGGPWCGTISLLLFSTLPPVLGHAALATTDMAALSAFLFVFYTLLRLMDNPTIPRIVVFSVAVALGIITKFSVFMFTAMTVFFIIILFIVLEKVINKKTGAVKVKTRLAGSFLFLSIILIIIWGGYAFSTGRLSDSLWFPTSRGDYSTDFGYALVTSTIPAPAFLLGWIQLLGHNAMGHTAYALGRTSQWGFSYFYPLALSVKTPLLLLLLAVAGFVLLLLQGIKKREFKPLVLCAALGALFIPLLFSRINIGIRHLLPLYPLLAVMAAFALIFLFMLIMSRTAKAAYAFLTVAVLCQVFVVTLNYPDYMSAFNLLGGNDPGKVLVDSDLDWGQDLPALERFCRKNNIEELKIAYWGYGSPCRYDLPRLQPIDPYTPVSGWVAVSEFHYRGVSFWGFKELCNPRTLYFDDRSNPAEPFGWLRQYTPVGFAGKSIRVYHIPE